MNKKLIIKNTLTVIFAFIATAGVCANLIPVSDEGPDLFGGNSHLYVLIFGALIFLINKAIKITDKSTVVVSSISAIAISVTQLLGKSLDKYDDISHLFYTDTVARRTLFEFFGLIILFYCVLVFVFSYLKTHDFSDDGKKGEFFTNDKNSFFRLWVIIFLAWMPYFIIYFPECNTVPDFFAIRIFLPPSILYPTRDGFFVLGSKIATLET